MTFTARWLQRDPSGYRDGSNLYEAFANNPLRNVDPYGLDSITEEDGNLVYTTTGFTWRFALGLGDGTVVVYHPLCPYVFRMAKDFAKSKFNPWGKDFRSVGAIMQHAAYLATNAGTHSHVEVWDPRSRSWVPGAQAASADENLYILAQEGLSAAFQDATNKIRTVAPLILSSLAAPTGVGGMVVDAVAPIADVATGRLSAKDVAPAVALTVAGVALHAQFGDDVARGGRTVSGRARIAEEIAGDFKFTKTVAEKFETRPYLKSPSTIREIMAAGKPIPDPGIAGKPGIPGALRWDVPGALNGTTGTWELVYDPKTNTVVHMLFTSAK